ncbi:hypothetical protein YC2023_010742 [Brassica napus]
MLRSGKNCVWRLRYGNRVSRLRFFFFATPPSLQLLGSSYAAMVVLHLQARTLSFSLEPPLRSSAPPHELVFSVQAVAARGHTIEQTQF